MIAPSGKPNLSLEGRTVLVTGANGGLGEQFVSQALERGAAKVYAAARAPRDWGEARIHPLELDVTSAASVSHALTTASDVDLLINNAGVAPASDTLFGPEEEARAIFETNFFGTLRVANAFSPILAGNGGGTMLNIVSLAAWIPMPTVYAASKAAVWSATNGLRMTLEDQGTKVIGLYVGMIDTPMAAQYDVLKTSAASVVAQAYDAIEAGALEVLADDLTRDLKSRMGMPAEAYYPQVQEQLRAFLA